MTPYECVHVPVKAAQTRLFGIPGWLILLAAAVVAWRWLGWWLVLAPALVAAVAAVVAVGLAVRRRTTGDDTAGPGSTPDGGGPVPVVTFAAPLACVGCGRTPATSVLTVPGYALPVCDPCRAYAASRLTAGAGPVLHHPTHPPIEGTR